jgi:hypothetical protein
MQELKRIGSGAAAVMATVGGAPLYNDILVISPNYVSAGGMLKLALQRPAHPCLRVGV